MPDKTSRRLEELLALIYGAAALVMALALGSYHPYDPSLNTATAPNLPASNLIGLAGAYGADLTLQLIGLTAFIAPLVLGAACWRKVRSRRTESRWAHATGLMMLAFSLMALLALPGVQWAWAWRWKGTIAPGGLVGTLLAGGLLSLLNLTGTLVALVLGLVGSVYLLTAFTFSQLHGSLAWLARLRDRWGAWRQARREAKMRRKLEKLHASGRAPVVQHAPGAPAIRSSVASGGGMRPIPVSSSAGNDDDDGEDGGSDEPDDVPVHTLPPAPVSRRAPPPPKAVGGYKLPSPTLLREPDPAEGIDEDELKRLATVLKSKCDEFGVSGNVTQINPGPVVTTYEFRPEAGIKYSRVTNLVDDLCLALQAESIMIERIPGKSTVGIEVPNHKRATIYLREIVESQEFLGSGSRLTLALGKDINGRIRVAELPSMPHLLIAGSTGSGKSVAINSFIVSMLYKCTPDQVRLILVDPKRLELGLYEGIPHLMTPIITEPKLAANALRNAVREMERRLKVLAEKGVRNIAQYNQLYDKPTTLDLFADKSEDRPLPYIVIIIDELADLMMIDSQNVEESITRLAQMARAVGIHLILATQRPSVDVLTGLIKANFPARISFRVATKVDSRTILDTNGAEALLGRGDMLYLPPGSARLLRVHGALVSEKEITSLVEFWQAQSKPEYAHEFLAPPPGDDEDEEGEDGEFDGEQDPMYEEAVRVVVEMRKASTSILQRRLRLGYGRAARILDMMQRDGIIGPPDGSRPREVLKRPDWMSEVDNQLR